MSAEPITYKEVANHNTKEDLWFVVNENVYNVSKFVDEHPGGEEVMMEVAGKDASDAFEDVGHSEEARGIAEGMKVAPLKRLPGDPVPTTVEERSAAHNIVSKNFSGGGLGAGMSLIVVMGLLIALAAYYVMGEGK